MKLFLLQNSTKGCSCTDCELACPVFDPSDFVDDDSDQDFVIVEGVTFFINEITSLRSQKHRVIQIK